MVFGLFGKKQDDTNSSALPAAPLPPPTDTGTPTGGNSVVMDLSHPTSSPATPTPAPVVSPVPEQMPALNLESFMEETPVVPPTPETTLIPVMVEPTPELPEMPASEPLLGSLDNTSIPPTEPTPAVEGEMSTPAPASALLEDEPMGIGGMEIRDKVPFSSPTPPLNSMAEPSKDDVSHIADLIKSPEPDFKKDEESTDTDKPLQGGEFSMAAKQQVEQILEGDIAKEEAEINTWEQELRDAEAALKHQQEELEKKEKEMEDYKVEMEGKKTKLENNRKELQSRRTRLAKVLQDL
jgi:hypothetical protein